MSRSSRGIGFVGIALAASLSAACGHTETHEALLRAPLPRASGPVALYMGGQPLPQRPFVEVAFVQAIGFGSDAHPEDIARSLSDKAASLGCDAVVRAYIDVGYSRSNGTGVCIRWLGPAPAAPPVALPPDRGSNPPPPPTRPAPTPRIEPLPSSEPGSGNAG